MLIPRYIAAWFLILALAILNGIVREAFLMPALGKPAAMIASGLLLSMFILTVTWALMRWLRLGSTAACLQLGMLWLSLTLVFEFGFGSLVQGRSLAQMLEAYTFKDGNIWPLVLAVTLFAPLAVSRLRR